MAGFVALVAGIIWGSKLGVQFSLSVLALKAPAGGDPRRPDPVPGAIIGGLILGVGEKLSEVYLGPMIGGGIEIWFAYVLALLFLLVRPQGLVRREDHRSRLSQNGRTTCSIARNGQFKTSYRADQQVSPIRQDRVAILIRSCAPPSPSPFGAGNTCSAPS